MTEKDIRCLGHLRRVFALLDRLHDIGCDRDRAGNRQLFCDQYVGLLLLSFFNPTLKGRWGAAKLACMGAGDCHQTA